MLKDIDVRQEVEKLGSQFRESLSTIKEELDEHLDTINQNTSEIQQNYEYLAEIEGKIDKLSERLDAIEMMLLPERIKKTVSARIELTHREQEVFMVIYAGERVTVRQIAKRLGFTEQMVQEYVENMISKGIPLIKELHTDEHIYLLEQHFKMVQAKQNILRINEAIAKEICT
ncbi:MAG: hypothetical protein V1743_07090 [Nanoarchaeota archaeon]